MQSNLEAKKTKKIFGGLTRAPTCYLLDRLINSETKRALILCANEEEADKQYEYWKQFAFDWYLGLGFKKENLGLFDGQS